MVYCCENILFIILLVAYFVHSMTTPPGSKLKLQGCVAMNHGFLLLTDSNCKVLGGQVEELIQRWHLAKVS